MSIEITNSDTVWIGYVKQLITLSYIGKSAMFIYY